MHRLKLARWLLVAVGLVLLPVIRARGPKVERIHELRDQEGVFAYARISPDGASLAYASEKEDSSFPGRHVQTVTVVDIVRRRIIFSEAGIDAYWSPDGARLIYLSKAREHSVSIRNHLTGAIVRDIAPVSLGDYYSWGSEAGENTILTILGRYYRLAGDSAVLPASSVPPCPGIGTGERPLVSKDGKRITTFVRGTIVVRSLSDCSYVFDTRIGGAKADFSWDGRYIAFHAPKSRGAGYDIKIVDLHLRTVRTITDPRGSSLFPSWTRDGRLCFRYDGPDYRGFVLASDVLAATPYPLAKTHERRRDLLAWFDVFPETVLPLSRLTMVLVWSSWSAHSPTALRDLVAADAYFRNHALDVRILTATDPGSLEPDISRILERHRIRVSRIPLNPARLPVTDGHNQMPATLLFRDGMLVDRRLGAQSFEELRRWVEQHHAS